MANLGNRIDKLEEAHTSLAGVVSKHLEESGAIRADLNWLKKLMWLVLSSPFLLEAVKHIHLGTK